MQKVSEIITADNSLFTSFKNNYTDLYTSLFGEIEPIDMDDNLLIECGERFASPLLIHHTIERVCSFLVSKYGENWKRIKQALNVEYDVTQPYSVKQTTTTEKTATNENTGESTDKSGIVGFDSETATDSSIDTNTNSNTTNQTETSTVTVENSGNTGSVNNASLINSEIELRKISLQKLILTDIQSQLTLDIY